MEKEIFNVEMLHFQFAIKIAFNITIYININPKPRIINSWLCQCNSYFWLLLYPCLFEFAAEIQLVVVCCREQEDRSHIINALNRYRVKVPPVELKEVRAYLQEHLTVKQSAAVKAAAELDPDRLEIVFDYFDIGYFVAFT